MEIPTTLSPKLRHTREATRILTQGVGSLHTADARITTNLTREFAGTRKFPLDDLIAQELCIRACMVQFSCVSRQRPFRRTVKASDDASRLIHPAADGPSGTLGKPKCLFWAPSVASTGSPCLAEKSSSIQSCGHSNGKFRPPPSVKGYCFPETEWSRNGHGAGVTIAHDACI